jgi:ACS family D-galactonate transporter-like MFS transporter
MSQTISYGRGRASFAPVLALLAICLLISYVDRGILSIAAPQLKDQLSLSATQLGILLAAFFWSYTAMQFVSGWLLDRFDVNLFLAAGFFLWSLATAGSGLVHGFVVLLIMRLLLGIGESATFPSCSKILARHVPEERRGFANGLMMAGIRLGPAVGTFGAGPLIARYGWRPVFIGIGLLSLLWIPAWLNWKPAPTPQDSNATRWRTRVVSILAQRSFWGAAIGHFSVNYVFYFMLTWLPFYLVRERGLSMNDMVRAAGIYYLTDSASAAVTGWLSDQWMRRGGTPTVVRKSVMAIGYTVATVSIAGVALAGGHSYFAWLLAAGTGIGMMGVGVFALAQTLAGPQAAAKWTGLQNGVGNFAGIIGPALTGFAVDKTGNFLAPFAITVGVLLIGVIAWVFVIGPVKETEWNQEPKAVLATAARE